MNQRLNQEQRPTDVQDLRDTTVESKQKDFHKQPATGYISTIPGDPLEKQETTITSQ